MVVAGIVLVIAGALTSVGIYTQLSQTQEVIAVVAHVTRGEQIQRIHLTTVHVGFDALLTPIPASAIQQIVGQYAVSDLVPGTLLSISAVGERPIPWEGKAEIGVALMAGEYPDDNLRPGDEVMLVALPGATEEFGSPDTYVGTLVRITSPNASNMITASILVSESDAPLLAALSALDRLAMVLISRER
jgi:hypothetical protein